MIQDSSSHGGMWRDLQTQQSHKLSECAKSVLVSHQTDSTMAASFTASLLSYLFIICILKRMELSTLKYQPAPSVAQPLSAVQDRD